MYFIDYDLKKDNFCIDIKSVDNEDFWQEVDFLKKLYMTYESTTCKWLHPAKSIDEFFGWLSKYGISNYELSKEAIDKIKNIYEDNKKSNIKYFRREKFDYSILNSNIKLFDYQKDGIDWRILRSHYGDYDDAGLGKSAQNILTFSHHFNKGRIDGIFITVPNGLTYHWKYEILSFTNIFKDNDIYIITNKNKNQPFEEIKDKKIIIVPIHLVADILISYRKTKKKIKSKKKLQWKNVVDIRKKWNKKSLGLIIDESHLIKNSDSIRSKALRSIRDQFNFIATLTATPAINRLEDFYNQLYMIDPSFINMSENAFKLWLADHIGDKFNRYSILSYNADNTKSFLDKLPTISIKRLKEDLDEMKTEKIISYKYLQLSRLQQSIYEYIIQSEISILEEEFDKITYKQILNKLPIIMESIDDPFLLEKRMYDDSFIQSFMKKWSFKEDQKFLMLEYLCEKYIEHQEEKVIVYGIHPKSLDRLYDTFSKYNPLIIHGGINTKEEERHEVQEVFNTKKENKLLLLSALTSSAGLNLQKGSNHIIVYQMPFDATLWRQLQDRIHRITSTKNSIIDVLYYPDTIDNIRVKRAANRVLLNDRLNTPITRNELKNLISGII